MNGNRDDIERLSLLSATIRKAQEEFGLKPRQKTDRRTSHLRRLRLADVLNEEEVEEGDPAEATDRENSGITEVSRAKEKKETLRLLRAWQTHVGLLKSYRVFLSYIKSIEDFISKISGLDLGVIPTVSRLVGLMSHTVESHNVHGCTELRYVTLLEIVLSYHDDWYPSAQLNGIWEDVGRRIDVECDNHVFRREAYTVLVNLPWVPSTSCLYTACSYEATESIYSNLPLHLQSKFEYINDKPLLRCDRVHQILAQVDVHEPFTIVISYSSCDFTSFGEPFSSAGMGKTTLAALLAAHPTIACRHTICWVEVQPREDYHSLSHKQYLACLEKLCQQLNTKRNWPDLILRFEDKSLLETREREHMLQAKAAMSKIFQRMDSNILLVLDGILDNKDYEWFKFLDAQSSIVISKSNYIPRSSYTVETDALGVDEAIDLFAAESFQESDHLVFQTVEASSIMDQCQYHPLAIRTAAHWFKMKQVTSGFSKAIEELNVELRALRSKADSNASVDASNVLNDIINLMLTPIGAEGETPTIIFKLCLASIAVVFSSNFVPVDAVVCLWSELLSTNPDARDEMGSLDLSELSTRVWFIAEAFCHLGILSLTEEKEAVMVRLHHKTYLDYGISLIPQIQPAGTDKSEACVRWHNCFVVGYGKLRKSLKEQQHGDACRRYFLENIITHMIEAGSVQTVSDRLRDEEFCRERLAAFGYTKATRLHLCDCLLFRHRAYESKVASAAEIRKVANSCVKKLASIVCEETPNLTDEARIEKATALHLLASRQAENSGINEALTLYKNALQLMTSPGHPFNATILYSQALLQLRREDYDKALRKVKGALKVLKENEDDETCPSVPLKWELSQLRGDILAASCDYSGAQTCYEEALDSVSFDSKLDHANALFRKGRLHRMIGELDQCAAALKESINWIADVRAGGSAILSPVHALLGDVYLELSDKSSALDAFQRSMQLQDGRVEAKNECDSLLLRGKILHLKDDPEGCYDAFEEARMLIRKSPRLVMDQSAYDLRCMADIYVSRGKHEEAELIFEEALELTKERPESLERANVLYRFGSCLLDMGSHDRAVACYEESLSIQQTKLGDCWIVLDTQHEVATLYRKLGLNTKWVGAAKQVMFLTERLYHGDDARSAGAMYIVAEAHEVLGEFEQAVAMFEECRERLERAMCNDHPDVGKVLKRLAKLHADHDTFDKAISLYQSALQICQANFEPDNPQTAEVLLGMGVAYRKMGDFESARTSLQSSLQIYKNLEKSYETCLSLLELGAVYRSLKETDAALLCYERCLTFITPDEADDKLNSELYLGFGHARLHKNEIAKAVECYENALQSRTNMFGRDHPATARVSRCLGIGKYLLQSFAEARIYLSGYVRVMETSNTMISIDVALALLLLGEVYNAESRHDEARKFWIRSKQTIDTNETTKDIASTLDDIVSQRLESASTSRTEKKTLFSRFTELARFEDEQVSQDVPIEQRIREVVRKYESVNET